MKFNPWPVAITVLCVAAFAAAATVVVVMVRQRVELVKPDYYAQDLRHQERMEQEQRARENPALIDLDAKAGQVVITFPEAGAGLTGTVTLYRPSDLTLDRTWELKLDAARRHILPVGELASGLWRVRVQWSDGAGEFYQEAVVTLP